jgi:hypothetical protein
MDPQDANLKREESTEHNADRKEIWVKPSFCVINVRAAKLSTFFSIDGTSLVS